MIDCVQFEELISDYLECGLARAERRSFAEHLLACRDCHLIFNDVRDSMAACHHLNASPAPEGFQFADINQRILKATSAGAMLSCQTLDALISDYFDGLLEGSYEDLFSAHFTGCESCRRLIEGVRQSLAAPEEVEVPEELYYRILAATSRAARS